jgi:hypothetical protein
MVAACVSAQAATGQAVQSRSGDYLFASTVSDARAMWVNPAGLAVRMEASIHAEFVLARPIDGNLKLSQWTAGFNSRGFSFGYQRDRFSEDPNTGTFRFGFSLPFTRGAVGTALSFYRGNAVDTTQTWDQGIDLGFRYLLGGWVDLGLVVRNIGRPVLRDSAAPLVGVLSLAFQPVPSYTWLAIEALASERFESSGYDMSYRAGLRFSTGGSLPFGIITAADFGSNLDLVSWAIGVSVGALNRGIALGTGGFHSPRNRLERVSLAGLVSRNLGGAR